MKKKIYLDDVRIPSSDEWTVVVNYDEFVAKVTEIGLENIEVISLDHDLDETAMQEYFKNVVPNATIDYSNIVEKTGYDAAKWLVAESLTKGIPLPQIYSHSANPVGAANIIGYINNYLKNSRKPQTCVRVQISHKVRDKSW
jgi:hypothetical protein